MKSTFTVSFVAIPFLGALVVTFLFMTSTTNISPKTEMAHRGLAEFSTPIERITPSPELPAGEFSFQAPYKIVKGPVASTNDAYGREVQQLVESKSRARRPFYQTFNKPEIYKINGEMSDFSWDATLSLNFNGVEGTGQTPNHLKISGIHCYKKNIGAKEPISLSLTTEREICTVVSYQLEHKSSHHDVLRLNLSEHDSNTGLCSKAAHTHLDIDIICQ